MDLIQYLDVSVKCCLNVSQMGWVCNLFLTLVCSFLSCLISAMFSLSFALSSRSCPTTADVWAMQDLIALSRLRWASIIYAKHKVITSGKQLKNKTSYFIYDGHTHRFIEFFACLCCIHLPWEGHCGHCGVKAMDNSVIYSSHCLQYLLKNKHIEGEKIWALVQLEGLEIHFKDVCQGY